MIEIVYDKEKQAEEDVFEGISLPKNIRQIGIPCGSRRIYIEDYVMTYLGQLANPNSTYARGAILVGETVRGHYGEVIFISGAIPAQNLELDLEETTFDENTWSYIYQEVKVHFPDLEVVGWFLSRMGFSTELNDMIVKLHMDNFYGSDKVLYIMDSLEGESAFYMREGDGLRRQSGYFVYYARNEAMQNFMILSNQNQNPEGKSEIEQKDEAVMRNYKRIMEERAKSARLERMNQRLVGFCSGLTIAVLALGVAVFSNYQMLEKMEDRLVANGFLSSGVTFYTEDLQEELLEASAKTSAMKETSTEEQKKQTKRRKVIQRV